jgi:tripartite-type tricarboxylate transporter receptor subunit TctC
MPDHPLRAHAIMVEILAVMTLQIRKGPLRPFAVTSKARSPHARRPHRR